MIKIRAAEFKHPIKLQRHKKTADEDNIPTKEWKDIVPNKTFKAKILNISGKEIIIAQADASINSTRFYIRYSRSLYLSNKDRIVYNNKIYNITYVSDIEEAHKYYEIVAELVQ